MSDPIRVLIADDHQILAEGLAQNLNHIEDIEVIFLANNGREVLDYLDKQPVHVVLMDIDMPILNGFEATKEIRLKHPSVFVIALSMHLNINYAKKIMKLGANGYLLKDVKSEEIVHAIRQVNSGKKYLDHQIAQRMVLADDPAESWIPTLTKREREILKLIAGEKTNQEIAESLFISLSTVEFHRKNLLRKFNVKNSIGLVRAALQFDLLNDDS